MCLADQARMNAWQTQPGENTANLSMEIPYTAMYFCAPQIAKVCRRWCATHFPPKCVAHTYVLAALLVFMIHDEFSMDFVGFESIFGLILTDLRIFRAFLLFVEVFN